jgi:hypothetical protein
MIAVCDPPDSPPLGGGVCCLASIHRIRTGGIAADITPGISSRGSSIFFAAQSPSPPKTIASVISKKAAKLQDDVGLRAKEHNPRPYSAH